MIRRLLPLLTLLALLAAGRAPAQQQEAAPCDLRQAHELYDKGRFDELLDVLPACAEDGRLEPDLRLEAQALLAKTLLALDEMERARAAVRELLARSPDFQPPASDPPRFVALVLEARRQAPVTLVSSVSKSPESLREAPATVEVVTGEQIVRRGYRDLSEIFDDLPGFDVSRGETHHRRHVQDVRVLPCHLHVPGPRREKLEIPADAWEKCEACGHTDIRQNFEKNLNVCPVCDYHRRIRADDYVAILLDDGSWEELETSLRSNPIAPIILSRSSPALPTNGSPCLSS